MTPDEALKRLLKGNQEHLNDSHACIRLDKAARSALLDFQRPFAVIVSCSDSRVPPELIFHQKLGNVFVVRSAGATVQEVGLGSIEYAVKYLESPLIMVLGHKNCGALQATLEFLKTGIPHTTHLQTIINAILPALKNKELYGQPHGMPRAVKDNVRFIVGHLKKASPMLRQYVRDKRIKIVGAYYNLKTGKVSLIK